MAAVNPQVVEPQEFIDILDYQFSGNDVTVENKRKFIEELRNQAAVYVAASNVGINKVTAYRWRESDSDFASAWDEALEDAADVMETSTYREALGTEDKPGNALLKMFWLKAHRPKFRDKVTLDAEALLTEIRERMQGLGLKELPSLPVGVDNMQTMPQLDKLQKDSQLAPLGPPPTRGPISD